MTAVPKDKVGHSSGKSENHCPMLLRLHLLTNSASVLFTGTMPPGFCIQACPCVQWGSVLGPQGTFLIRAPLHKSTDDRRRRNQFSGHQW